jgi:hypothetical protein
MEAVADVVFKRREDLARAVDFLAGSRRVG